MQDKLRALREEIEACPFPVQPYSALWNPRRYDRVNRTRGQLDDLDAFGKEVEAWLWEAIRAELNLPDTPAAIDPLDAEADLHQRFLELRTRLYVGRDALYGQLRDFALAEGKRRCCSRARAAWASRPRWRGSSATFAGSTRIGSCWRTSSAPARTRPRCPRCCAGSPRSSSAGSR